MTQQAYQAKQLSKKEKLNRSLEEIRRQSLKQSGASSPIQMDSEQVKSFWQQHKAFRYLVYAGVGLSAFWASKYLFRMMAGNIRAFKDLVKSIKEP